MKQFWLQVTALLIVIFVGLWVSVNPTVLNSLTSTNPSLPSNNNPSSPNGQNPPQNKTVAIVSADGQSKTVVNIEVADTPQKRAQGLGGRGSLDSNSGMLFIFEQPTIPRFWMKGMKVPIDIIWISNDTIVGIVPNIPPPASTAENLPTYSPAVQIDKVLEVNANFANRYRIAPGDKLQQMQ